jgi:prolipoprotein diacylglyceryltransferase
MIYLENMNNFWTNLLRYPRFLISSILGLILVILTPFRNLFKTPKLRTFTILVIFLIIISLYNIVINMVGL